MKRSCTTFPNLAAFLAGACLVGSLSATGDALTEYRAAKQKALAPVQAEYERIVAAHRDDPAVREYQERLALVDEVTWRVLKALDAISAASAASVAGSALGDPDGGNPLASDSEGLPTAEPVRIVADYRSAFEEELPVPTFPEEDQAALRKYAGLGMSVAAAAVAERGRIVHMTATSDELARQALCLAVALPLLGTRDDRWAKAETVSLPRWMREAGDHTMLEDFFLRSSRPLTAYQFSAHTRNHATGMATSLDYLRSVGRRMSAEREYRAAISCLGAAIGIAKSAGQTSEAILFAMEEAEALQMAGNTEVAAATMGRCLAECSGSPHYARVAMLRLKYLYLAGQHDLLVREAPIYRAEQQCIEYAPQLLYLEWAATRHAGTRSDRETVAADFLRRFPNHPLAGDILCGTAMAAMKEGSNSEALRLLTRLRAEQPDYRFSAEVTRCLRLLDGVRLE
jgi:hypothetical protein